MSCLRAATSLARGPALRFLACGGRVGLATKHNVPKCSRVHKRMLTASRPALSTNADFDTSAAEQVELAMKGKTHEELLKDTKKQFTKIADGTDRKFLDPEAVKQFVVSEIKQQQHTMSQASMEYMLSKVDECLVQADKNRDGQIELDEFFDLWRRLSMVQLEGVRSSTGVDLRAALETMISTKPPPS